MSRIRLTVTVVGDGAVVAVVADEAVIGEGESVDGGVVLDDSSVTGANEVLTSDSVSEPHEDPAVTAINVNTTDDST